MARVPLLRNIEGLPRKQASRQGQVRIWQLSRILVRVHPGAVDLRVKTRDIPSSARNEINQIPRGREISFGSPVWTRFELLRRKTRLLEPAQALS
jgi:hypothetical protein